MPKINVGFMSLFVAPMGTAYALSDCSGVTQCVMGATDIKPTNCKTMSSGAGYGDYCLYSCSTCKDGYSRVWKKENLTGCSAGYYDCQSGTTTCTADRYLSAACGTTPAYTLSNCSSSTKKCFGGAYVQTCDECKSGYTRTSKTYTPSGCSNSYTYYDCKSSSNPGPGELVKTCFSDGDCTEGVGTTDILGGTQTVTGDCVEGECEYTTTTRCNANYYRSGSSCKACPYEGDVAGLSAANSIRVTACYIPANTYIEDTLGKFIFTSDCYYDNTLSPLPIL